MDVDVDDSNLFLLFTVEESSFFHSLFVCTQKSHAYLIKTCSTYSLNSFQKIVG